MSKEESSDKVPTYWHYLDLEQLLSLQGGLEDDEANLMPDELHFIIVHQTLELWFKLTLSELRLARNHLDAAEVPEQHIPHVVHHMGRMIEILKLAVQQFDVVETLTARDFLAFRDKLFPASGFQSFQLREIEISMGLEESKRAKLGKVSALKYLKDLAPGPPVVTTPGRALSRHSLKSPCWPRWKSGCTAPPFTALPPATQVMKRSSRNSSPTT